VRIALDNQELDKHPLRIGLSSDVTVDITDDRGAVLAPQVEHPAVVAETTVYEQMASQADAEADQVIRANLGASGNTGGNHSN
jgi:membrane fusion protein (multidrug efflux system)